MADGFLPIQNVTADKKLDTTELTVGANTVERERVQVSGAGATELADVKAATPTSGLFGMVVRPLGQTDSGGTDMTDTTNHCLKVSTVTMPQVIGPVAHAAADAQAPVKVGMKAKTALSTLALAADANVTDMYASEDGVQFVRPYPAHPSDTWDVSSSTTGTGDVTLKASGGAGVRTYITSITVHNAHASTNGYWGIKDGATSLTSPRWVGSAPANGGYTFKFDPPLRGAAATAWTFAVSASITTIFVSATGYLSKV